MRPRKTPLAVEALQTHRAPLTAGQRRLLILCDGHRDIGELARLLGAHAPAEADRLRDLGYLADADAPAAPPAAAPDAAPPPATPPSPRRSLGAARFYLQDMLALQRGDPRADALHGRLLDARGEEAIVAALVEALALLPALTTQRYADRVRRRVEEVLPEAFLTILPPASVTTWAATGSPIEGPDDGAQGSS